MSKAFLPPAQDPLVSLQDLVGSLRAAGEDTRLRVLALLAEGELNVSDLTDILASRSRASRAISS